MSSIEELKFDKKNFNKHTPHGMSLIEKSLRQYGAGRSVLVDKDNNIIAGNGVVESAINAGIKRTKVIETTGEELVVVKRTDVELDSERGREMALADNATGAADLEWDEDNMREVFDDDYQSLNAGGMAGSGIASIQYKTGEQVESVLNAMRLIEDSEPMLIVGGYSAGSPCGVESRIKQNIMQVFFSGKIDRFFREKSNLYRNNDDVCACIMAKHRGYATFGLWSVMRSVQTPEQQDNTNNYDSRSYVKSFLPILYSPTCCKLVWCKDKTLAGGKVRPGRFHHIVQWSRLTPKMVERRANG